MEIRPCAPYAFHSKAYGSQIIVHTVLRACLDNWKLPVYEPYYLDFLLCPKVQNNFRAFSLHPHRDSAGRNIYII